MLRRDFLHLSTAAAAGFCISAEELLGAQPKPQAVPKVLASPPVLQNPAPDAMTVTFAVDTISTGWVEYGPTPALGSRADDSRHGLLPLNGRVHQIRIKGLKPGTKYHYRIVACPIDFKGPYKISRGKPVESDKHSFTTLDEGRFAATSFAVINDTHENGETLKGLAPRVERAVPDLLFWNGDIFNDVRSDDQIVGQVLRFGAEAPYASKTPLCFVSGNHDVRGIHARSLDRFLDVPAGRRYYTLRRGPVAFLVLDTGEDKPDTHAVYAGLNDFARYRDEQARWLTEAIKADEFRSAPFRIVILHIPLWGNGCSEDSRRKWHALLETAKVHAVINGHIHVHSFTPAGKDHSYSQLIGGGPKPEAATVIEGHADGRELSLVLRDLGGKELGNYAFKS
jgi:acid phosphatase type 7